MKMQNKTSIFSKFWNKQNTFEKVLITLVIIPLCVFAYASLLHFLLYRELLWESILILVLGFGYLYYAFKKSPKKTKRKNKNGK